MIMMIIGISYEEGRRRRISFCTYKNSLYIYKKENKLYIPKESESIRRRLDTVEEE
jgi:hypothetical protein